ncbi:EamA family transporter [Nitrospinota bacterium]
MLDTLHPNLLALLAAVNISVARTLYRGALTRLSPGAPALVTAAFAWGLYFYTGGVESWPLPGVAMFVAVGLLGVLGGRYLSFLSMKTVGLARTSVLTQTSLVWSSGLAVVFLGEHMTLPVGAGTLAIMIGSSLLVHRREEDRREIPFAYYLIPLAAAFFAGVSHLIRKFGLFWIPSVPLGWSIASTTAALLLLAIIPFTGESQLRSWERRPLLLILAGAVFNTLAALFLWMAIQRGELVQVIPIDRLSVLLMIFFSWVFFQKQENVTARVVVGGALSVAGAFAIVSGK